MTRTLTTLALALTMAAVAGCGTAGDMAEQALSKDGVTMNAIQRVERKVDSLRVEVRALREAR